jgi:glycosyltransferase involved in cell wall biosynthesis
VNLAYVSGLFLPASGGAELSAFTLLRYLAQAGHSIIVITDGSTAAGDAEIEMNWLARVIRLNDVSLLGDALSELAEGDPGLDAILTQSSWCDRALSIGRKRGIPVVYFLRSCFGDLDLSLGGAYAPTFVVANSARVKQYIVERWQREDTVIVPPLVDVASYRVLSNSREFITMINPVAVKGGDIFKDVAAKLPHRRFLAVRGWDHLRSGGTWDRTKLQDLAAGFGVMPFVPDETNFAGLPNVQVRPTTTDMRSIYGSTRLLVVPSVVPEGGPRVAIEAMVNGIPVIMSEPAAAGGMVRSGGDVIRDFHDVEKWVTAIRKFDDPRYYAAKSRGALDDAAAHDPHRSLEPLLKILDLIETRLPPVGGTGGQ